MAILSNILSILHLERVVRGPSIPTAVLLQVTWFLLEKEYSGYKQLPCFILIRGVYHVYAVKYREFVGQMREELSLLRENKMMLGN